MKDRSWRSVAKAASRNELPRPLRVGGTEGRLGLFTIDVLAITGRIVRLIKDSLKIELCVRIGTGKRDGNDRKPSSKADLPKAQIRPVLATAHQH